MWDINDPEHVTVLGELIGAHTSFVRSIAFSSPGGKTLESGSNQEIRLWNVEIDVDAWREKLCDAVNRNLTLEEWQLYIGDKVPYFEVCPNLIEP